MLVSNKAFQDQALSKGDANDAETSERSNSANSPE